MIDAIFEVLFFYFSIVAGLIFIAFSPAFVEGFMGRPVYGYYWASWNIIFLTILYFIAN